MNVSKDVHMYSDLSNYPTNIGLAYVNRMAFKWQQCVFKILIKMEMCDLFLMV